MVEIRQSSYMWQNVKLNRIQAVLLVALVRDGRLPDVDCNGNHKKALRQARRDARKLAGIFDCTNYDTTEEGMWQ